MIKGALMHHMERLVADREPFVTATVVRTAKPTSVRPGDSALVLADGTIEGFVGGVCAQASVRLHAARVLETGDAILLRLLPGTDPGGGEDEASASEGVVVAHNPCLSGGSLEIFLEPQIPAPRVVIAGETPIARALETLARAAGYAVERGAGEAVRPGRSDAAVIVASHGAGEERVLVEALEAGVSYVGLVASASRGRAVVASLDVPEALRAVVHTPAGLDIGARAPADVAISILAELVAERTTHGPVAAAVAPAAAEAEAEAAPVSPVLAITPPATAIDPVCGMEVMAGPASVHLDVGGQRVHFCCEGCRSAYVAHEAGDVAAH